MRIAAALWRSSHPGPTVVVTVLALALGVSVGVEPGASPCSCVSVLLGQLSIGISNDAIDAPRDRLAGRTDKPLARGDVPVAHGVDRGMVDARSGRSCCRRC